MWKWEELGRAQRHVFVSGMWRERERRRRPSGYMSSNGSRYCRNHFVDKIGAGEIEGNLHLLRVTEVSLIQDCRAFARYNIGKRGEGVDSNGSFQMVTRYWEIGRSTTSSTIQKKGKGRQNNKRQQ